MARGLGAETPGTRGDNAWLRDGNLGEMNDPASAGESMGPDEKRHATQRRAPAGRRAGPDRRDGPGGAVESRSLEGGAARVAGRAGQGDAGRAGIPDRRRPGE